MFDSANIVNIPPAGAACTVTVPGAIPAGEATMNDMDTTMENSTSFALGWSQVTVGNMTAIKRRIMHALNISTRASWANRLRGQYSLTPAEQMAIERIFADYGITRVWGQAPEVVLTGVVPEVVED